MPKSDFLKFIDVARSASPDKAEYLGDGVFRYREGGMTIYFTEKKLK
jgi:hypothetical protein